MKNLTDTLRTLFGVEEIILLLGILLVYIGSAAQFGHPIAMIVTGAILIIVAVIASRS